MAITASFSSPTLLDPFQSSKDFFMNSHALISTKSISSSPKPETQIEICSKKGVGTAQSWKWKTRVSFFPGFLNKGRDVWSLKDELFEAIAPLDRGAEATPQDHERIDQIARKLEEVKEIKQPLTSNLLNGKWELLYTTSEQTLQAQRPKFLRPNGKIYQAINLHTLRAQNIETWPFFIQATANLVPLNATKVAVTFDFFKIGGVIQIKSPVVGRGELEITYLDQELRISRGNLGNLFILKMVDPSYKVPL